MEKPSGFEPLQAMDPVMAFMGPIYAREERGHTSLGFFVAERHQNPRGNCHGGILASFADLQLGINSSLASGLGGPTVSLTIDYLRPVPVGAWVEGRSEVLHESPGFAFVQCVAMVDGQSVMRASGTFRLKWPRIATATDPELAPLPQ